MNRNRAILAVVAAIGLSVAACQSSGATPPAQPGGPPQATAAGTPKGPDVPGSPAKASASAAPRWQPDPQLLTAARAEKEVVWYTSSTDKLHELRTRRFEEATGLKLEATNLSAGPIRDRLLRERQAGLRKVDVVSHGVGAIFLDYKKRGLLGKYTPKGAEQIRKEFQDPDGQAYVQQLSVAVIAYNPKLITAGEAPKKWLDATDAKFYRKTAMADPRYSGVTLDLVSQLVKLYGWTYFEKLKANQVHLVRGIHENLPLLLGGERPLVVGAAWGSSLPAKEKGGPIELVFPEEGTYSGPGSAALLADAPHPNGARLLLDFLFSEEMQAALVPEAYFPVRDDVSLPAGVPNLRQLKLLDLDAEEVARTEAAIKERWATIFGG